MTQAKNLQRRSCCSTSVPWISSYIVTCSSLCRFPANPSPSENDDDDIACFPGQRGTPSTCCDKGVLNDRVRGTEIGDALKDLVDDRNQLCLRVNIVRSADKYAVRIFMSRIIPDAAAGPRQIREARWIQGSHEMVIFDFSSLMSAGVLIILFQILPSLPATTYSSSVNRSHVYNSVCRGRLSLDNIRRHCEV